MDNVNPSPPPLQLGGWRVGALHQNLRHFRLPAAHGALPPAAPRRHQPLGAQQVLRGRPAWEPPALQQSALPGPVENGALERGVWTLRGRGVGGSMCVQACETYFNFTSVSGGLCVNGETVTLFGITKHLGILRKKWYFKTVFAYKIHWWGQTTFGCFGIQSCLKGDWFSNSVDRTVPPRCVSNP